MNNDKPERYFLGKVYKKIPKLDLLAVQKDSYRVFLKEGIANIV